MIRALVLVALLGACDDVFDLVEVHGDAAVVTHDVTGDALPTDLVAYFPMDGVDSNRVRELVGSNDGLCAVDQCPVSASGHIAGALSFDGTDDLVRVETQAALETTGGFTLALWIKQSFSIDFYTCPASKLIGTAGGNSWQLCVSSTSVAFYSADGVNSNDELAVAQSLSLDVWHHVALRWDGSEKSLWIDGVERGFKGAAIGFDGGDIVIGTDIDDGSFAGQYLGLIDDVRLFDRALDPAQIVALAQ